MKLLWLSILVTIVGCKASPDASVEKVYEKRAKIISTFNKVSVFTKRTGEYIFLYTYNGEKKNEYVFTMKADTLFLFRDSLLFNPDPVLGFSRNEQDSFVYKKKLIDKLKLYLREMDSLLISDISSDFFRQGIDLKIYLKSGCVLVYVSDIRNVVNDEWRKYLKSMSKLDENWHYVEKE